jgi:hypothetical protein
LELIDSKKFLLDEYSLEFYKSLLNYGYEFADTVINKIHIQSDISSNLLELYSEELYKDMLNYGREFADSVINKKQYHLFDPMVSDWSCHLRAVWLCCFLKNNKFSDLCDDDFIFFGLVRLLCESATMITHEVVKSPIKTKTKYWPESIIPLKNKIEKEIFYGIAKKIVASRTLNDLERWFCEIPHEYVVLGTISKEKKNVYEELLNIFSFPYFFSFSEIQIPMVPFFHGIIITFSLAAYFNIPLLNFTKDIVENDDKPLGFSFINSRIDSFNYDNTDHKFIYTENQTDNNEPAIIIDTYRFYKETDNCKNDIETFLNFCTKLNFSYIDAVYFLSATHELLPNNNNPYNITSYNYSFDILQKCKVLGEKIDIFSRKFPLNVYQAMSCQTKFLLEQTLFDIIHIRSCSLKELKNDQKFL